MSHIGKDVCEKNQLQLKSELQKQKQKQNKKKNRKKIVKGIRYR